jgi:hypothetical protein
MMGERTVMQEALFYALRFLFLVTLRKPAIVLDMPFVSEPRRLPIVLSPEEEAVPGSVRPRSISLKVSDSRRGQ